MKILVVVDMQNDFITGSLGNPQAQAIVENVRNKIKAHAKNGDMIIYTLDTHDKDYLGTPEGKMLPVEHCIEGTKGWMLHPDIESASGYKRYLPNREIFIQKDTFGVSDWNDVLEDVYDKLTHDFGEDIDGVYIDEIELIGLCTDICVVTNALLLKTFDPEIKITVDASCCAGVTEESHKAALLTMRMCQVNVINE